MRWSLIALTVLLTVLIQACNRHRAGDGDDEEEGASPPAVVQVHAGAVVRGDMPVTVTVTGKTDVLKKEKVFAPTAGKIISLRVLEFQPVHEGDVLAVIRTKESQAAVEGARALLQSATTEKQKAEAQQALNLASGLQASAVVRATLNGVVSTRSVTEGEWVSENSELLTIIDPATVCFVAQVPLHDVADIRVGQRANVRFPAMQGKPVGGVVDALSPQSDLQSQTVGLRIRFPEAARSTALRPEMAGTAELVTGMHRNVLLVGSRALLRNDETGAYTVVTVARDSLALSVPVRVVQRNDSIAEISGEAVREGTLVVREGNYALADSTKLRILPDGR